MKRTALLMAAALMSVAGLQAQKPVKGEMQNMAAFLNQTSATGVTNAQELGISDLSNPTAWPGVKTQGGSITEIDWHGKKLAGNLNLSGFANLVKVDLTDNKITTLDVSNDPSLVVLNAGRNHLAEVSGALRQEQHAFRQRGLTVAAVAKQTDVADLVSGIAHNNVSLLYYK